MPDSQFRELAIRQGAQSLGQMVAGRIRNRKPPPPPEYKEPERPALRTAEALIARGKAPSDNPADNIGTEVTTDSLFDEIEDREEAKDVLLRALRAPKPVHVLLVGEPGCGKTQLLRAIAKLPHSRYAVGGATSSSGLLGYLLEKPQTRNMIVDDLHLADREDFDSLYELMGSGTVSRLQHGDKRQVTSHARVFAAANTIAKIPEPVLSRFVVVTCPVYSQEQARDLMASILERREGMSKERAQEIASAVSARSRDPRDAVQVALLAGPEGPIEPVLAQVVPSGVSSAA